MLEPQRPRFFQFTVSSMLLVVACASIGGYLGHERNQEVWFIEENLREWPDKVVAFHVTWGLAAGIAAFLFLRLISIWRQTRNSGDR